MGVFGKSRTFWLFVALLLVTACEAVRAMVSGILSEAEFETLVQHKSMT